jgi:4-hydroxy-2-oxoheptanedioate aldolase
LRKNTLKTIWSEGRVAINGWCGIPSSWSAEIMAHQGYDSVTVDLQHGIINYDTALPMLQAISTTQAIPLARVPWNEPGIIMKMLDAGCYGIICPMINSREECERFVGACRYANVGGYRSNGPTRALYYAGSDYFDHANDEMLTFAMIETAQAVANVDEIVSTPGLNAVYVGPSDLSLTIKGRPQMDYEGQPDLLATLDTVVAACKKHGVARGIHCTGVTHAQKMIARGFNFVSLASDGAYLASATGAAVKQMRESEGATGANGVGEKPKATSNPY